MNCRSCGGPLRADASGRTLVCDYCKNVQVLDTDNEGIAIVDEESGVACPVCGHCLSNAILAAQPIRFCRGCRGILFDMARLVPLIESVHLDGESGGDDPIPSRAELSRKLTCPSCHIPMETHPYYGGGHVVIGDCERCSLIWLDYGKLKRIAIATRG